MKINPDNQAFLTIVAAMSEGDSLEAESGMFILEYKFSEPTHFAFHQRIFPAGIILKKLNSNIRIFIEAEKLGHKITETDQTKYKDKQKNEDGSFKKADRGLKRNKVKIK